MDVLPAFALPIIRTRNWISGIRGRGCWVSIASGATVFGKARVVDRLNRSMVSHDHLPYLSNPPRLDSVVKCIHELPKQFAGNNTPLPGFSPHVSPFLPIYPT